MRHLTMEDRMNEGSYLTSKKARELRPDDFNSENFKVGDALYLLNLVGFTLERANGHFVFYHPNKLWWDRYVTVVSANKGERISFGNAKEIISVVCIISHCLRCMDAGIDIKN